MSKILIIEDDISIAELERDYLEINGFEVELAHRGELGLALALDKEYDLIIVDLMLPGIDGFEICKQIRKNSDVPMVLVSALTEDIDKIRGLGLGADDYVTKPFSPNELVARVKAHIQRYQRLVRGTGQKEKLQIGTLIIEESSRRVFHNQKEIVFTTKEFDLLFLLANNPNRVFTKEELFEKIWGIDSQGDISTVTVHIRKIREKIEKDPSTPLIITTIWGVGYRFEG